MTSLHRQNAENGMTAQRQFWKDMTRPERENPEERGHIAKFRPGMAQSSDGTEIQMTQAGDAMIAQTLSRKTNDAQEEGGVVLNC